MNTPLNESNAGSGKTWNRLVNDARHTRPPMDIDVRHSVRAALMAEASVPRAHDAEADRSIMDELAKFTQSIFMRIALGGCAVVAVFSLWAGIDAVAGLSALADLQGGLIFSSYITP